MLDEVSKNLENKINVISSYNTRDLSLYPNINFLGYKNNKEIVTNVFPSVSLLLLTSNYEGLPFVCIEALSHGIPIAIRDTFSTAKWLINNGSNGLLFKKEETAKQISNKLKQYDRNKIIHFAKTNFSNSNFINTWKNILEIKQFNNIAWIAF